MMAALLFLFSNSSSFYFWVDIFYRGRYSGLCNRLIVVSHLEDWTARMSPFSFFPACVIVVKCPQFYIQPGCPLSIKRRVIAE